MQKRMVEEVAGRMSKVIQENAELAHRLHVANETIENIENKINFDGLDKEMVNGY